VAGRLAATDVRGVGAHEAGKTGEEGNEMTENGLYRGRTVLLGTGSTLNCLRASQVSMVEQALNSLNVTACLDVLLFRFAWPDEDRVEPGGFEEGFRSLPVPGVKPFAQVGHRKDGCDGDAAIVYQRWWEGRLITVCQCTGCGVMYRMPELEHAQPVIDGLVSMAYAKARDGDEAAAARLRSTAARVAGGYPPPLVDTGQLRGRVLVNRAAWDGPKLPELFGRWVIVNAPRPLLGEEKWTGVFRHGTFYAAMPAHLPWASFDRGIAERSAGSWKADDAWLVVFTDNAEIECQVLAKFAEYGYASEDEAGVTIPDQAACMGLPWHAEPGK
jgi:hypothetical protein